MNLKPIRNFYQIQTFPNEQAYLPIRFTQKQLDYYKSLDQAKEYRSRNTAGICLDFFTDSDNISFDFTADCFSRGYVGFDFYEDNVFLRHEDFPFRTEKGSIHYDTIKKGNKRITIYIPALSEIKLYNLDLGEYELVQSKSNHKILFIGDSITQGMTALSPSLAYTTQTAVALDADFLNRGVGGGTFDINTLDELDEYKPTTVSIAYGINDMYRIEEQQLPVVLKKADEFLYKAKQIYKEACFNVITPLWCLRYQEEQEFKKVFEAYSIALSDLANKHNMNSIDGLDMVPHNTKYFQDLSLHPNDAGFNHYTDNLLKKIKL